jgi:hypothetical protein
VVWTVRSAADAKSAAPTPFPTPAQAISLVLADYTIRVLAID